MNKIFTPIKLHKLGAKIVPPIVLQNSTPPLNKDNSRTSENKTLKRIRCPLHSCTLLCIPSFSNGCDEKGLNLYSIWVQRYLSIHSFECGISLLQTLSLEPHVIQGDKIQFLVLIYNATVTNCDNLK